MQAAYHDKNEDRIVVFICDCHKYEESPVGNLLTLYKDTNQKEESRHIGFAIELASKFCEYYGLEPGWLGLWEMLELIEVDFPDLSVHFRTARTILEELQPHYVYYYGSKPCNFELL